MHRMRAAASSARQFATATSKMPSASSSPPLPNYASFLSRVSSRREPSAIRALQPLLAVPGMISLGGGMPNPESFPFKRIDVEMKSGESITLEGAALEEAMQYSATPGLPDLVALWKRTVKAEHNPPMADEDWGVCVTGGSQDGLAKIFEMLLDETRSLIVESPTYSGALAFLKPLGCKLVGITTDADGLDTNELEARLRAWREDRDGPKPRVVYTIPCGSNPTGATLSLERRKHLVQLATEHDLIIIEDDPYYFLQFSERLPSLFSLSADRRVIRCDSLSKLLSSGIRIGFISAPNPLLQQVVLHQQSTALHTSGLSQAVTLALLRRWEGNAGFEKHVQQVVNMYRSRCEKFLALSDKYLKGKAEWVAPSAGMFVWYKLRGVADTNDLIMKKAVQNKVLLVPGGSFSPDGSPSAYVRAAFSTATEEEMETALQRFAALLDDK